MLSKVTFLTPSRVKQRQLPTFQKMLRRTCSVFCITLWSQEAVNHSDKGKGQNLIRTITRKS